MEASVHAMFLPTRTDERERETKGEEDEEEQARRSVARRGEAEAEAEARCTPRPSSVTVDHRLTVRDLPVPPPFLIFLLPVRRLRRAVYSALFAPINSPLTPGLSLSLSRFSRSYGASIF